MTMISSVCQWFRSGGDFTQLRRLSACFRASLGESNAMGGVRRLSLFCFAGLCDECVG